MNFKDHVIIVTGAANGLGRSHALAFAARGARLVINDPARLPDGEPAAEAVARQIRDDGGDAIANMDSVTDSPAMDAMAETVLRRWGRIDALVNNAGIIRDKSFAKMDLADFRTILDVHVMGSANCSHAVWEIMRQQKSGRIVMTTSASGLYGNFGQANYGTAKAALVGLMNVLSIEGERYGIRVNAIAPLASTGMTRDVLAVDEHEALTPDCVSAGVLFLASEEAPTRMILCAGGGSYAATRIYETSGIHLPAELRTPEAIAARLDDIVHPDGQAEMKCLADQSAKFMANVRGLQP